MFMACMLSYDRLIMTAVERLWKCLRSVELWYVATCSFLDVKFVDSLNEEP